MLLEREFQMRAAWSVPLTEFRVSDVGNEVGKLRFEDGKVYKFVQNKKSGALVVGDSCNYNSTSDPAGNKIYQCDTGSNVAGLGLLAGIAISAIPADYYGWIQVWGYNTAVNVIGHASLTPGSSLKCVTAVDYLAFGAAEGTAPLAQAQVIALEAYATTTTAATKKGFIRCL